MSNGIVHSRLTKQISFPISFLLGIIVFPLVGFWGSMLAFISCLLGFIFQLLINPDLDQFGLVSSEWWIIRKFGILGWWFVGLFDPYCRWLIPKHRHFLSHGYFVGTFIRFIYIFLLFYVFSFFVPFLNDLLFFVINNWDLLLYFFIGTCIGDIFHSLLDFNLTFRKWYESL